MYWTKLEYNTKWYFEEMAKSPHALIGGATGSGKSVALNGFIMHLLQKDPSEVNLILIDPKMVELRRYRKLPHVWKHATTSEDISEALIYAEWLMNERYKEMAESDDDELIARKAPGSGDISGDYTEYERQTIADNGDLPSVTFKGNTDKVYLALWTDETNGYTYSLMSRAGMELDVFAGIVSTIQQGEG